MRITVYYVITPNTHLIKMLDEMNTDMAQVFWEPQIYSQDEGGHLSELYQDVRTEKVKLLYLAATATYYTDSTDHEIQTVFEKLFSVRPWTTKTFDKWWNVQRIDVSASVEYVENNLEARFVSNWDSDSPEIREWRDQLLRRDTKNLGK